MADKNIFGKVDKTEKSDKNIDDRGAKDDWEALAIVLNERPSLKQRVLHKLRTLRQEKDDQVKKVPQKSRQEILEQRKKEQGGK